MRIEMRWIFSITILSLVFLLGCSENVEKIQEKRAVRIGVLLPMSGPLASAAEEGGNGLEMAIDELNGALFDEEIELVLADTQADPEVARAAALEMAEDGIKYILGPATSSSTLSVSEVTVPQGVILITPGATAPSISNIDDEGSVWRVVPSDEFQAYALAQLAIRNGCQKITIVHRADDYGRELAVAFMKAFTDAGGTPVNILEYEEGEIKETEIAQMAICSCIDSILMISYETDGATIVRAVRSAGFTGKILATDSVRSRGFIVNSGIHAEGVIGVSPAPPEGDSWRAFREMYLTRYGVEPGEFSARAYDAMIILGLVATGVNNSTLERRVQKIRDVATAPGVRIKPNEIEKAIEILFDGGEIDYEGASGSIEFDEVGDVKPIYRSWKVENGEFVIGELIEP